MKGSIRITITRDALSSPEIDKDDIYISPKATIPNDDKQHSVSLQKATDPNGAGDIVSVSVGLADIGLPPTELTKGQTEGTGAWYSTEELTIPRSVIPGIEISPLWQTDTEGNTGEEDVRMLITTPEESGDGPIVDTDSCIQNPRSFRNNQEEQGTIYVFVEEGDAPVAHVTANLGTILQYVDPKSDSEERSNATETSSQTTGILPFLLKELQPKQQETKKSLVSQMIPSHVSFLPLPKAPVDNGIIFPILLFEKK